ncbi:MAG: CoA ester lyase [Deltaproteobacteria bacterium]|nr:CoA ester lyase [Deltaproteobacteria bacterium]MBW2067044.1 CoA ester lyase [Deltaproteobacteria bacterium]
MFRVLRSMLYVPSNSWRMITNAKDEGADVVILDLEDGCPISEKETGRIFARDSLLMLKAGGLDVFVRVNSLETGLTEIDLSYVVSKGLDGIMLAKTESREDIINIDALLKTEEQKKGLKQGSIELIALIETPKGVLNVKDIIESSSRLCAVAFGAGDFSREMGAGMGVTKVPPEEYFSMILHARSSIAIAARAAGIQAVDTPFFGFVIDLEGLAAEAEKVKLLGYSGKQVTHPRHVGVVNKVFAPAREDVDFAREVVEAYEEASRRGLGATTLGGKMIDYGSFKRAESLLTLARALEKKNLRARDSHAKPNAG